ncbi:MAG: hypothetical protein H7A25_09910 [Leptospiraceae bacterium]|nr:hypothetical protein [Leptospiraceae bacterium]
MKYIHSFEELISLDSWLPVERKREIAEFLIHVIPQFQNYRNQYIRELSRDEMNLDSKDRNEPAWTAVSRTNSQSGWRLILGLNDQKCAYRKTDPLQSGCFNCGFYSDTETTEKATVRSVLNQLQAALEHGKQTNQAFDVIEFLSDGSFLTDLSNPVKEALINEVAKLSYIKRLLIESRPDGIVKNEEFIRRIVRRLGRERSLEIATGMETADEFIRTTCIHKGFTKKDFEQGLETIARINREEKTNISYLAYILIKPAFLTSEESIIDAVKTLEYLNGLMKASEVKIIPKLEPATLPEGTLFMVLHNLEKSHPFHYRVINYWAILEILVRANSYTSCKEIFQQVRIGERNDMGSNLYLPGIYDAIDETKFLPEDSVLYKAIQEFNYDHDINRVLSALQGMDLQSLKRWSESELNKNSRIRIP